MHSESTSVNEFMTKHAALDTLK
uniref:Uncharacterized protein n=1 Tax=Arundo donax TaxID=35708 RepID=A0A0A9F060_ARUDO